MVRGRSICSSCSRLWDGSAERKAESKPLQVCARMNKSVWLCVCVCVYVMFVCFFHVRPARSGASKPAEPPAAAGARCDRAGSPQRRPGVHPWRCEWRPFTPTWTRLQSLSQRHKMAAMLLNTGGKNLCECLSKEREKMWTKTSFLN